jgi:drug/metabolite transporter (DMT)-like permease
MIMSGGSWDLLIIGFGIACVGFIALGCVNFSVRRSLKKWEWRPIKRTEYWAAVKGRAQWRWLLYGGAICIFAGIVAMFGAIVHNNQMRLR